MNATLASKHHELTRQFLQTPLTNTLFDVIPSNSLNGQSQRASHAKLQRGGNVFPGDGTSQPHSRGS